MAFADLHEGVAELFEEAQLWADTWRGETFEPEPAHGNRSLKIGFHITGSRKHTNPSARRRAYTRAYTRAKRDEALRERLLAGERPAARGPVQHAMYRVAAAMGIDVGQPARRSTAERKLDALMADLKRRIVAGERPTSRRPATRWMAAAKELGIDLTAPVAERAA